MPDVSMKRAGRTCCAPFFFAFLSLLCARTDAEEGIPKLSGGARAYFESAYISSTGKLGYTRPVAEQYLDLKADFGRFGWVRTDAWIISDLTGQQQATHRCAMYCYEGTLVYGYDLRINEKLSLSSFGGILWDWLGGYKNYAGIPICWHAAQRLDNKFLTPYWNGLGLMTDGDKWHRIRVGVDHPFIISPTITLTPYVDFTFGNEARFRANYGGDPQSRILMGMPMFSMSGIILKWKFWNEWYLWGRYRHMFVIDPRARELLHERGKETDKTNYPFFGLGVGLRF